MKFWTLPIAGLLISTGVAQPEHRASAQTAEPPNVLIIVTDDQSVKGTMSVMPKTRALFQNEGTRFRNAVVTTPRCCPSRASIFSGRYVHNHGVVSNSDAIALDITGTMQYQLNRAGYLTGITGKYLNSWNIDPPQFDRWATFKRAGYYSSVFNLDGTLVDVPDYSTTFVGAKTKQFLNYFESQSDQRPWFMYVAPFAPHGPADPEISYQDTPVSPWRENPATSENDLSDKLGYVRRWHVSKSRMMTLRANQQRSLMSVDDMVAAVFDELEALGEANNTIAFFLSDNGVQLFEHRLSGKRLPYDASVRVPLFVRWPNRVDAGVQDWSVVANIDVAPTVYAAAGLTPSYEPDGKDLFTSSRRHILTEQYFDARKPAIPEWKSIWSPGPVFIRYTGIDRRPREYYTAEDRWQLSNVYRDGVPRNKPPDEGKLDRMLYRYSTCSGSDCP